jgi:hypothetical protein
MFAQGHLFLLDELRRRVRQRPRPIGILAAGAMVAYTVDHRPIWRYGGAPLRTEKTTTYDPPPRKASRLDLSPISRGAYPLQQVQRTLALPDHRGLRSMLLERRNPGAREGSARPPCRSALPPPTVRRAGRGYGSPPFLNGFRGRAGSSPQSLTRRRRTSGADFQRRRGSTRWVEGSTCWVEGSTRWVEGSTRWVEGSTRWVD